MVPILVFHQNLSIQWFFSLNNSSCVNSDCDVNSSCNFLHEDIDSKVDSHNGKSCES